MARKSVTEQQLARLTEQRRHPIREFYAASNRRSDDRSLTQKMRALQIILTTITTAKNAPPARPNFERKTIGNPMAAATSPN